MSAMGRWCWSSSFGPLEKVYVSDGHTAPASALCLQPLIGGIMPGPKREARWGGLMVIGIALIAVGIAQDTSLAFIGAGVLFMIIGGVNMRKKAS